MAELDCEFRTWQLAGDGGVEGAQLRVKSLRKFHICYTTVIFGVCNSVRLLYVVAVLQSVARIRIVENVID
jgi:hypothetical protein